MGGGAIRDGLFVGFFWDTGRGMSEDVRAFAGGVRSPLMKVSDRAGVLPDGEDLRKDQKLKLVLKYSKKISLKLFKYLSEGEKWSRDKENLHSKSSRKSHRKTREPLIQPNPNSI